MSFKTDLDKFKKKTLEKHVKVKRLSSLDLFSAIVMETPVDFGVLRNNWFAEIGRGSSETTDSADLGGQKTINRIEKKLETAPAEKDIFLTNNLPYAVPIEFDGISGKAPQGMVRVNTLRWGSIVKRNAKKVENEF